MNQIMRDYYPVFEMYQALRQQLMATLTDDDLQFQPGGENLTLAALCQEMGEVQLSYIASFKTFTHEFSSLAENNRPMPDSVAALTTWFNELDVELKETVSALSDEDIANRMIVRGPEFKLPPNIQLTIYNEALLIFYGKVSVYLKMMGKERSQQWQDWIG